MNDQESIIDISDIEKEFVYEQLSRFLYFGNNNKNCRGFDENGQIKLRCGKKSDWYADIRSLFLYENYDILDWILRKINESIKSYTTNQVIGYGYGGAIIVSTLAGYASYDGLVLRSEKKEHGMKNTIIGYPNGKDVVLIEDVLTSGDSLLTAINIIEKMEFNIVKIIVVMDRQEEEFHLVRDILSNYDYTPIFTYEDVNAIRCNIN